MKASNVVWVDGAPGWPPRKATLPVLTWSLSHLAWFSPMELTSQSSESLTSVPFWAPPSLTVVTTVTPDCTALRSDGNCAAPKSAITTRALAPCATAALVAAIAPWTPDVPLYQLAWMFGHLAASASNSAFAMADHTWPPADLMNTIFVGSDGQYGVMSPGADRAAPLAPDATAAPPPDSELDGGAHPATTTAAAAASDAMMIRTRDDEARKRITDLHSGLAAAEFSGRQGKRSAVQGDLSIGYRMFAETNLSVVSRSGTRITI